MEAPQIYGVIISSRQTKFDSCPVYPDKVKIIFNCDLIMHHIYVKITIETNSYALFVKASVKKNGKFELQKHQF